MQFVSASTAGLDSLVNIALDDVGDRHKTDAIALLIGSGTLGTPISPIVLAKILVLIAGPFDMEKHCASTNFPLRDLFPPARWSDTTSLGLELTDSSSLGTSTFLDSMGEAGGGESESASYMKTTTPSARRHRRGTFTLIDDEPEETPLDATLPKLPLIIAARLMDATLCALGVGTGIHLFSDSVGSMHTSVTGNVRIVRELLVVRAHRMAEAKERLPPKVTSLLGTVGFLCQTRNNGSGGPGASPALTTPEKRLVTPLAQQRARSVLAASSAGRSGGRRSGGRSAVTQFTLPPPSVEEFTRNYLFLSLLSAVFCVDRLALKSLLRGVPDNVRTASGHGRSSFASLVVRNATTIGVALVSCFGIEMLEGYGKVDDVSRSGAVEDLALFLLDEATGLDVSTTQYLRVVGALLSQVCPFTYSLSLFLSLSLSLSFFLVSVQ
jgi:hypothetical protein